MQNSIKMVLEVETKSAREQVNALRALAMEAMSREIPVKLDAKSSLAEVEKVKKSLVAGFDTASNSAKSSYEIQKKVVASMAIAGKEGTREFNSAKKALAEAKAEAERFDKALKAAEPKSFADSFKGITSSIGGAIPALSLLGGVSFASVLDSAVKMDTATAKIRTLGGAAKEIAPDLQNMMLEMSREIPLSPVDLQTAAYDALSAGISATTQDMESFVSAAGKLAVGGSETVGNSVNLLSSLINAYGESAEKTAEYSDKLFTTVNLGKTSIPELNASLSQVIPTAAAMGVNIDNVGASLAYMTANGIPTAQATTKLNSLLNEMLAPGEKLAPVLQKAGVTLQSLADEGLPVTVGKINGALKEMGRTAGAAFSSTEASAAFNTLSKDVEGFSGMLADFENSAGTTDAAFQDMGQSVGVQFEALKASIEAMFISIGSNILPAITGVTDVAIPAIQTISDILGRFAPQIGIVVAAYGAWRLATMIQNSALVAEILAVKGTTAAITFKTIATNAATAATKAMAAAWATNPLGIAVLAITAAVTGFMLLKDALSESTEEKIDANKAELEYLESQKKTIESDKQALETKKKLVDEYIALGRNANRTNVEQTRFASLQAQLNKSYPGLINNTKDFSENLGVLERASAESANNIAKLGGKLSEIDRKMLQSRKMMLALEADLARGQFAEKLDDTFSGLFGDMSLPAKKLEYQMNKLVQDVYGAKTQEALQSNIEELKSLVANSKIFDSSEEKKAQFEILGLIETFGSKRLAAMNFYNKQESAADEQSKDGQVNAFARLEAAAKEYAKVRSTLSEQVRIEKESGLKQDINSARQNQQITDQQKNALFLIIDSAKQSTKSSKESSDSREKDAIRNIQNIKKEQEAEQKRFEEAYANRLLEQGLTGSSLDELRFAEQRRLIVAATAKAMNELKVNSEAGKESQKEAVRQLENELKDMDIEIEGLSIKVDIDDRDAQSKIRDIRITELSMILDAKFNPTQAVENAEELISELQAKADAMAVVIKAKSYVDKVGAEELKNQLFSLNEEINSRQQMLDELRLFRRLEGVRDVATFEREISIYEAERTYAEEQALAGDNQAMLLAAHRKFIASKRDIDAAYLSASLKSIDILTSATKSAMEGFAESLIGSIKPWEEKLGQLQERLTKSEKTNYAEKEQSLKESYSRREISMIEYHQKTTELEEQKKKEDRERSNLTLQLQIGAVKAFESAHIAMSGKMDKANQNIANTIEANIQRLKKEGKTGSADLGEIFKGTASDVQAFGEAALSSSVSTFGAMLAAGEEFGSAFRKGLLGDLLATAQKAILTYIPQIYAAFLGWLGPWGIPAATAALGIVYSGLQVAKSAIGAARDGKVDIDGPGTETSDSILYRVSRGESILTAKATKQNGNIEMFKWMNRTGGSWRDYAAKDKKLRASIAAEAATLIETRETIVRTHNIDISELTSEVVAMRKSFEQSAQKKSEVNLKLSVKPDKTRLIKEVEIAKTKDMMRK